MTNEERQFSFPTVGEITSAEVQALEQERTDRMEQYELHERAENKIDALIFVAIRELRKWENETPYFALSQEMIDGVIEGKRREIDVLQYIKYQL